MVNSAPLSTDWHRLQGRVLPGRRLSISLLWARLILSPLGLPCLSVDLAEEGLLWGLSKWPGAFRGVWWGSHGGEAPVLHSSHHQSATICATSSVVHSRLL